MFLNEEDSFVAASCDLKTGKKMASLCGDSLAPFWMPRAQKYFSSPCRNNHQKLPVLPKEVTHG